MREAKEEPTVESHMFAHTHMHTHLPFATLLVWWLPSLITASALSLSVFLLSSALCTTFFFVFLFVFVAWVPLLVMRMCVLHAESADRFACSVQQILVRPILPASVHDSSSHRLPAAVLLV